MSLLQLKYHENLCEGKVIEQTPMSKTGKTLTAFVVGAAAGALAGVLLAPDRGKQTRKKIAQQVDHLGTGVSHQLKNGGKQVRKMADQKFQEAGRYRKRLRVG